MDGAPPRWGVPANAKCSGYVHIEPPNADPSQTVAFGGFLWPTATPRPLQIRTPTTTEAAIGWLALGRDSVAKPHVARFKDEEGDIAKKGAEAMSYHLLHVVTPEAAAVADRLPVGRPYATGKGFAPLIKQTLYDELAKLKEAQEPGSMPAAPSTAPDGGEENA